MVQKYQNEIAPIFYYGKSPKTNRNHLKLPYLQAVTLGHVIKMTLYVERHVTWSKLTLKFTGYCRQTSYTDSTVIHTLVPAVAWELQSQFAPGYMHFNIIF